MNFIKQIKKDPYNKLKEKKIYKKQILNFYKEIQEYLFKRNIMRIRFV